MRSKSIRVRAGMLGEARLKSLKQDYAGALALADKALAKTPESPEAWQIKGEVLNAQRKDADAVAAFRKVIALKPDFLSAHWALVGVLVREGDSPSANEALAALKKIAPKHPQTYYVEALVRAQEKNYPAARDAIQQQLALAPDNPAGTLLAAAIDYELGSYDRAEARWCACCNASRRTNMRDACWSGRTCRMRQPAKALDALKPMLGRMDSDAAMQNVAGEVFLLNGDPTEAADHFEKAAALDPTGARQKAGLALTRLAQGDTVRGVKDLEAAAAADAGTRSDLMLISVALRRRHWDEALTAIDALEKKEPNKPLASNLRGLALLGKLDTVGARKSFERALALDPNFFPAVVNLARVDLIENNCPRRKSDSRT